MDYGLNFLPDVIVPSGLINMYAKHGQGPDIHESCMLENICKTLVGLKWYFIVVLCALKLQRRVRNTKLLKCCNFLESIQ